MRRLINLTPSRPASAALALAPFLGLLVVDGPGGHVAVDGQLFARHPVQRKARTDLGHAGGTLGDDHEVHDQQHAEHHQPQEDAATHDELCEPFDHIPGGVGAGMTLTDDQLG